MENFKKLNAFTVIGLMCFLVMIFTCVKPNIAQAEVDSLKVATYEQDLEILDIDPKATGNSITAAKDLYFKTFTEQDSPETRDAAFLVFNKYYLKILDNAYKDEIYDSINFTTPYKEENHPDVIKVKEIIALQGLQLVNREGNYEPETDSNYLAKTFGKFVSPAIRAYLTFTKSAENIFNDGALMISVDELRKIIILGDSVAKKYPDSYITPDVKKELNSLVRVYIYGIDNSPVYEDSKRNMLAEVKKSLNNFIKENKDSTYYPLMQYVYNTLKKNNFRYTDKAMKAIREKVNKELP